MADHAAERPSSIQWKDVSHSQTDWPRVLAYVLALLGGLALLLLGAEGLVRGSSALALRMGVSALTVGLTIVAFGTSSPELVLGGEAARSGNGALALGNVIGSNISNLALVLGFAALIRPLRVRSQLIKREMPIMIAITFLLLGLLLDGELTRFDGVLLLCLAVVYVATTYAAARKAQSKELLTGFEDVIGSDRPVRSSVLLMVAGLAGLLGGANLLLWGATSLAVQLGVSQLVIGLTVVAIGTSLPELVTAMAAARRGEADVAFGNVIGSNVLNVLAVLGLAVIIQPISVGALRGVDVLVFAASAVLLLPLMWRGCILNRWEGAALLVGYAVYIYSLV